MTTPSKAVITIKLKQGVLDPQGKAIAHALHGLGFDEVADARMGKVIELDLSASGDQQARQARIEDMCQKLLANPVIEDYRVDMEEH